MSTHTPKPPVSALHEILAWSTSRPAWQRDALRRILASDSLSEVDLKELDTLCRADAAGSKAAAPLDASHIPASPASQDSVSLVSLGKLTGVNRLSPSQVLTFGPAPGITIVYGDNGTGKSGYARVLKKACRARGIRPAIHPDAYTPAKAKAATAEFCHSVGGAVTTSSWTDGVGGDPKLANVFLFDGTCASHYLAEDQPASFTPFGLDLLPKLAKVCDHLRTSINSDMNALSGEIAAVANTWKYGTETKVGKLVGVLKATTKDEDVKHLAGLDEKQTARFLELATLLKTNPKQKAKETRAAASRITSLAGRIKDAAVGMSGAETASVKTTIESAISAAATAKIFAENKFDETYLPGTGSKEWKKLWDAARAFSDQVAYAGKEFPLLQGLCVLCQQPLAAHAPDRLTKFESFAKDESQKLAKSAADALKAKKETFSKYTTLDADLSKIEADLSVATPDEVTATKAFVKAADTLLGSLQASLDAGAWSDVAALPESPYDALTQLSQRLEKRAVEEESADDPVTRKTLQVEHDELEARAWLASNMADVLGQIDRYKALAKLGSALADTSTTAITKLNNSLTHQMVTQAFCSKFNDEVAALGLKTLNVKLECIEGAKGKTKFGLRLVPNSSFSIQEVASEGEQRCIALAAFMAELSQATHRSALVFDDPVTSLDHEHRYQIAQRIALEANFRQVIVFTHDTVFLNDLEELAREQGLTPECVHLIWNGKEPGHIAKGLPWESMRPQERLSHLEQESNKLAAAWPATPSPEQIREVRVLYSQLRATVERIVERVVLGDVVFRYRDYVKLKDLDTIVGFSQAECDEIKRIFQKCSDITEAHDPAPGKHVAQPSAVSLKQLVAETTTLLQNIKKRIKGTP